MAILAALALALVIGFLNGALVIRTGLPSFIVTLGTFFVLQGVNLAVTKRLIGQVSVTGFQDAPGFTSGQQWFGSYVKIDLGWLPWVDPGRRRSRSTPRRSGRSPWSSSPRGCCCGCAAATGSSLWAARRPAPARSEFRCSRTKILLFMTTAGAGWLVGMLSLFKNTTAQSTTGVGEEFIYIICAVVGGCLLTGGYGSAVGAALGALIYGMVDQGIVYEGWDNDWKYAFLGVMLLLAVIVNNWVKARAERVR